MRKTVNIVTAGMLRRGRQDCFDGILVFPGNGELFAGNRDGVRRGECGGGHSFEYEFQKVLSKIEVPLLTMDDILWKSIME